MTDQADNVWTINNYKPNFDIDALSNPGADGIVIFVGLAASPANVAHRTRPAGRRSVNLTVEHQKTETVFL